MHHKVLKKLAGLESPHPVMDHLVALVLLVAMIVVELKTPQVISPLISVICFGYFSYSMRPCTVAGWVSLYCITSLYFLFHNTTPIVCGDNVTAYIRFGTLCVAGIGAVVLADNRIRVAESYLQTVKILEKQPVPVIVSDAHGCIVFMNNDALALMDVTADEVIGASYFSFVVGEEKGRMVQNYFDFLDSKEPILNDMVIQIKKPKPRVVRATIAAIEGKEKLLATVISLHPEQAEVLA